MTVPLDPKDDPDRFDPDRIDPDRSVPPAGPLDPALDPDRYAAEGRGDTLPELLGAGAYDDTTSPYLFLLGLLGVLVFLGLVALIFSNLSP